jgi:hypothetical protein
MTKEAEATSDKDAIALALWADFGAGNNLSFFRQELETAFEAAKGAGTLPTDNMLMNGKPATTPECKEKTDPIAAQIDMLADDIKDAHDCTDFAPEYYCGLLA